MRMRPSFDSGGSHAKDNYESPLSVPSVPDQFRYVQRQRAQIRGLSNHSTVSDVRQISCLGLPMTKIRIADSGSGIGTTTYSN